MMDIIRESIHQNDTLNYEAAKKLDSLLHSTVSAKKDEKRVPISDMTPAEFRKNIFNESYYKDRVTLDSFREDFLNHDLEKPPFTSINQYGLQWFTQTAHKMGHETGHKVGHKIGHKKGLITGMAIGIAFSAVSLLALNAGDMADVTFKDFDYKKPATEIDISTPADTTKSALKL